MSAGPIGAPPVTLRPARRTDDDALLCMRWRNDPATLAASLHTRPKVWPAFRDEYLGYFDAPIAPQFGLAGGEPIAFLRFRRCGDPEAPAEDAVDISINVAPEARGLGLGRVLIAEASRLALVTERLVLAEIRPGNEASVKAFLRAGYRHVGAGVHEVDGVPIAVERYVLRRAGEEAPGG